MIRRVLSNGVVTLAQRSASAPAVAIQVWVRVGSADEGPGEAGLAHVHEHMLFKGTSRRGVGEIAATVEGAGGEINAYTSYDQTVFHLVMASRYFETGLDVLADAIMNSAFDAEELVKEVDVICEEISRAEDSAGRITTREIFRTCFHQHPYRNPVIGTVDSVRNMSRDQILSFFKRWYVGRNVVIVASGDLDEEEASAKIEKAFGSLVSGETRDVRPHEPPQEAMRFIRVPSRFDESHLNLAFHIPGVGHSDVPALDLLALILGQGDSSRLVLSIKDQERLVNDVISYAYTPMDPGLMIVAASLPTGQLASQVCESILTQCFRMRETLCRRDEIEKAKAIIMSQRVYGSETVQGHARRLGYFEVIGRGVESEAVYYDGIESATVDDICRVANTYLDPRLLSVVNLAADGDSEVLSADDVAEAVRRASRQVSTTTSDYRAPMLNSFVSRARNRPVSVNRTSAGEPPLRFNLPNGPHVLILPDSSLPIVAIRTLALGGLPHERGDLWGSSRLMASVFSRGTTTRSATDLAVAIESVAGHLEAFSGRDVVGLRCGYLSQYGREGWDLFAELLLGPAFDTVEIEHERSLQLEEIRCQGDRPATLTLREMVHGLFWDHTYGRPVMGTRESVDRISHADLLELHKRIFHPSRLVIAVTGDVDAEKMMATMESLFADEVDTTPPVPLAMEPIKPMTQRREIRLSGDGHQAHVALGYHSIAFSSCERPALDVLLTVLSGQGGRLFLDLRDRKSLAYSVTASSFEGYDSGFLYAYIGTSPEKVSAALDGLETTLLRMVNERISTFELERAQRYLVGTHDISLQRCAMRAAYLGLRELYQLPFERFDAYVDEVQAVTCDDVQALAAQLIHPDRACLAIFEPKG